MIEVVEEGAEWLLPEPDDWHLHLRDFSLNETQDSARWREHASVFGGDPHGRLPFVLPFSAYQFRRVLAMPNTSPNPITTGPMAVAYRERIVDVAEQEGFEDFEPVLAIYITPGTTPEMVREARAMGVAAGKFYPRHGTTGSGHGVYDFGEAMYPVYEAMEACGMLALFHGADPNPEVDIFDKEAAFIPIIRKIRESFPALVMVFEHMSTSEAVDFVSHYRQGTFGTITPQHLHWNRNQLLGSGLNPAAYCMPPLQPEMHRRVLRKAAVSGSPKFFAGTDSAPHFAKTKYCEGGCMGCFTAPHAYELYAEVFEEESEGEDLQWLRALASFTSHFGADAYRLPRNAGKISLRRETQEIPERIELGRNTIVPFRPGEQLRFVAERVPSKVRRPFTAHHVN